MPTVAQAIAQTLAAYGTEQYFCLTGGDHDLWIALHEAGIEIVNCRSEAGATYMADGYARVSGRPGFVYGQRGPGAANVAAAMADAYWAMSPVVSLTTSIAMPTRDRFQYQDVDTLPMHGPVTVWNKTLSSPHRAADMVRAAIRVATGPVPGPVHLEVPADMLPVEVPSAETYREPGRGVVGDVRLQPDREAVRALVAALSGAERPLIVSGNGTIIAKAWDVLEKVAALGEIPVATTVGGKGSISEHSPLSVGVVGRYSRRVANELVHDADLVLAVGTRLGGLATAGWSLPFADKRLLHIDADPSVIGHNFRTELGVVGDARLTLQCVLSELERGGAHASRDAWLSHVRARVGAWQDHASRAAGEAPPDGMHPAAVLQRLHEAMGEEDVLVADTGGIAAWAATFFPVGAGRRLLRSAGSLGWALPGAIGAAIADRSRRTVCFIGDGGLLYHMGELETAVRFDVPVVVIVLNNRALASESHLLKNIWKRDLPEVTDYSDAEFSVVASGLGARSLRVDTLTDLPEALKAAFAGDGPVVVDVRVSKVAQAPTDSFRGESPV